jgi:hypothetical protein
VRERLHDLAAYFMNHGVSDAATAQRKAIVALGHIVRRQYTITAYADTFAALCVLLLLQPDCCCSRGAAKPSAQVRLTQRIALSR